MRSLCPGAVLEACAAAILPVYSPLTSHTILLPGSPSPLNYSEFINRLFPQIHYNRSQKHPKRFPHEKHTNSG